MSALIIDYSELQTIATNATSLASKAENYCNELNSNVYSAFGSVTAGVNDVLSSAMYYVAVKQKSLTEKAEEYARFAGNVCTLIEHAKQADQDVATKIENNQEDFLKKHSEIQAAEGIEAFLLNLFVEVKNACPLFEIVADCYIAVFDTLDSAFDALKYFYECGGGKELLKIVLAVAGAVLAVAAFIAVFPISMALSLGTFISICGLIGAGIGVINAATNIVTSVQALNSRVNGDPAWASIYDNQDKLSDVIRGTNFGNGTINKWSNRIATGLDFTEVACNTIFIFGSLGTIAKRTYDVKKNQKAFDYYMQLTEELDVSSAKDAATFYSGPGNRELAEAFARENGKTTLEMTKGGKYLDELKLFEEGSPITTDQAAKVWGNLSRRYAEGASGTAYAFIKGSRPTSIFNTIEYNTLLNNPDVTNVISSLLQM